MGKTYKRGNHGKSRKYKDNNNFYAREQKLNKLINRFVYNFFHLKRPASPDEYEKMDKQRLEIKRLFDLQSDDVWRQSARRRYFYYKQLARFKYYYVAWKRFTYYIYLEQRYGCPLHLSQTLIYYCKNTKDIISTIYML